MKLIGNTNNWEQLMVAKNAAMEENRPLPHTLLNGAAGCGKTSTARELARQSGSQFLVVAPESIKTRDDVVAIIKRMDTKGYDRYGNKKEGVQINYPILFIDEIHRIPKTGQEHLGIAMEEWQIPVDAKKITTNILDQFGLEYKDRSKWCPQFTLIGATTDAGILNKPFKDRFKIKLPFEPYSMEDSILIVKSHAASMGISIEDGAAMEISKRGRGVPRILVGLLERCRDFMRSTNKDVLTTLIARAAFLLFKIDDTGMTDMDIRILKAIYNSETPLGIENLSIIVNESGLTISESIEPYLIQRGFMIRTSRGRILTDSGKMYLIKGGYINSDVDADTPVDIPNTYKRRI